MEEKLYANYVKKAREYRRPLMNQTEFFKAVKLLASLYQEDPMSTGILEADAMEMIVMLNSKEIN